MHTPSQIETPAAPPEVALLGVPKWLWPTIGKAISAASVMAMLYLQAAQCRDERVGLDPSSHLGPSSALREILALADRPAPNLHEAFAAHIGDPPPNTTAALNLRDILAQVQTLLGGAITPGAAAGAPAPPPPAAGGLAAGASPPPSAGAAPPNETPRWPPVHWHGAAATSAANAPTTRLPAGLVSTDHLPRYRPEFTREGSSKRPTTAATSSPPTPSATAPAPTASREPDRSASQPSAPPLMEVVRRVLEAATVHLDTLTARVAAMESRLAALEARGQRPIEMEKDPAPKARHDHPLPVPPPPADADTPATSSTAPASSPDTALAASSPAASAPATSSSPDAALADLLTHATPEELHHIILLLGDHNAATLQRTLHLATRLGAVETRFAALERGSPPEAKITDPVASNAPKNAGDDLPEARV